MNLLENQRAADVPAGVYQDLEEQLMANIIRHCRNYKQPIDTDKWLMQKLAEIGKLNQENIKIISKAAGFSQTAMERLLNASAEEAAAELEPAMQHLVKKALAGKAVKPEKSRNVQQVLKALRSQAKDTLNLCNTTMLYKAKAAYQKLVEDIAGKAGEIARKQEFLDILNKNATAAVVGAESRQQAVIQCIKQFNARGIPAFVDKRGREWTPEAYVSMVMRNTAKNVAEEVQTARCTDYGVRLIEISSHSGARPKCARDQGKIYSLDNESGYVEDARGQKVRYYPWNQTSYGEPDGILGINCTHHKYPFSPGISLQSYFPAEDMDANDRLYRQTQVQRALERSVRKQKRECMLFQQLGDEQGFQEAAAKLKEKETKLAAYVDGNKQLHRRKDREQVVGFDKSTSAKAVAAGKKAQKELAEKARNDRIKKQIKAAGLRGEVELNPKIPDVKELSFDDTHINQERSHNVSEEEAKSYIEKARFSVTKWNGRYTNFFSDDGAAYVDNEKNHIRTAFRKEEFDDAAKKAMEVVKREES